MHQLLPIGLVVFAEVKLKVDMARTLEYNHDQKLFFYVIQTKIYFLPNNENFNL